MMKCSFDRVSKNWKHLLENWPRLLLADELRPLGRKMPFRTKIDRDVLQEAFTACRVIIIDLCRTDYASWVGESHLNRRADYIIGGFSSAVARHGNLEQIIVTGGRMVPGCYFEWLGLFRLPQAERRWQFSLVNCNMVYAVSQFVRSLNYSEVLPTYKLFPEECTEARMPKWSVQCPTSEEILHSRLLTMFRKLLFPYHLAQVAWLADCRETARNLEQKSEDLVYNAASLTYRLVANSRLRR